jgi:hypothetical protein
MIARVESVLEPVEYRLKQLQDGAIWR